MITEDHLVQQKGFSVSWEPTISQVSEQVDGFSPPRDWQLEAFNHLKNSHHMILNAPMGSGKSWMMCLLSAYKMHLDPQLRCIIAVPQTIIAPGFSNAKLLMPDGCRLDWSPMHNLCEQEFRSTTKQVIRWLERSPSSFNDRILICTHQTLVSAHNFLTKKGQGDLLKNLLVWIDEAHHVKNSLLGEGNAIGSVVSDCLKKTDSNIQIGLTTATFFRGDRDSLVSPDMEALFSRFNLPYDRYLQAMKHLKSFNYDFVICGHDYMKAIDNLNDYQKNKDIIYIPKPRSQHSKGCKYKEVKDIIGIYQKKYDCSIIQENRALTILGDDAKNYKILDLVNEDYRKEKKEFLADKRLQSNRDHLDIIIALDMFKEGANWIWAERRIIVGPRGSLVDIIQMIGRLFRDARGKEHVQVVQLLPFSLDQKTDDFRKNLNNYLKAIYSLLILEDILKPIQILTPKKRSSQDYDHPSKQNSSEPSGTPTRLYELIPDENRRSSVIQAVNEHLGMVSTNDEAHLKTVSEIYDEFQKGLPPLLQDERMPPSIIAKIGDHVWSSWVGKTLTTQGIDIEHIDFDIIQNTHPLDGLIRYTSGACGINTFQQLREAIQGYWEFGFALLKAHFEKTNSSVIPQHLVVEGVNLFNWATVQRKAFKNGTILEERKFKLERLPLWYWDHSDVRDLKGNAALQSFVARENHTRIPTTHIENGFRLGLWLNQKKALKDELAKNDVEFFEALPEWSWDVGHDQTWEYAFSMLLKYVQITGHAQPPSGYKLEGFNISTWVKGQREAYRNESLSKDKAERLLKLPEWSWRVFDDRKKQGFAALDSFVAREGHALVSTSHIENGFPLGRWISQKRQAHTNPKSKNKITEEERKKLESYPWWFWDGDEGRWERGKKFLLKWPIQPRSATKRLKFKVVRDGCYLYGVC